MDNAYNRNRRTFAYNKNLTQISNVEALIDKVCEKIFQNRMKILRSTYAIKKLELYLETPKKLKPFKVQYKSTNEYKEDQSVNNARVELKKLEIKAQIDAARKDIAYWEDENRKIVEDNIEKLKNFIQRNNSDVLLNMLPTQSNNRTPDEEYNYYISYFNNQIKIVNLRLVEESNKLEVDFIKKKTWILNKEARSNRNDMAIENDHNDIMENDNNRSKRRKINNNNQDRRTYSKNRRNAGLNYHYQNHSFPRFSRDRRDFRDLKNPRMSRNPVYNKNFKRNLNLKRKMMGKRFRPAPRFQNTKRRNLRKSTNWYKKWIPRRSSQMKYNKKHWKFQKSSLSKRSFPKERPTYTY